MNTYSKIRMAMRQNERELLTHLRKHRVTDTFLFGRAWRNALDRLMAAKKVVYRKGRYIAMENARPVTKRQRPKPRRIIKRPSELAALQGKSAFAAEQVCALSIPVLRVKVNGAGTFQMANLNSRNRHWERSL